MLPRRVFRLLAIGLGVAAALAVRRRALAPGARTAAPAGPGAGVWGGNGQDGPFDVVLEASEGSFPASDPPGWIEMST